MSGALLSRLRVRIVVGIVVPGPVFDTLGSGFSVSVPSVLAGTTVALLELGKALLCAWISGSADALSFVSDEVIILLRRLLCARLPYDLCACRRGAGSEDVCISASGSFSAESPLANTGSSGSGSEAAGASCGAPDGNDLTGLVAGIISSEASSLLLLGLVLEALLLLFCDGAVASSRGVAFVDSANKLCPGKLDSFSELRNPPSVLGSSILSGLCL